MATSTPYMNLIRWNQVSDYFSHSQLAANFLSIDEHDHTTGKGVQIPYGGLAALSVGSSELRTASVIEAKINDGAVSTNKLANTSVTTGKLASGSATSPKVALTNGSAVASSSLTLGASAADIAGASITFTPAVASTAIITGTFDFQTTAAATLLGELQVDGVTQTGGVYFAGTASGARGSVSRMWHVDLTAAAHTIKLRAYYTSGSGTANAYHTQISYILFSQ